MYPNDAITVTNELSGPVSWNASSNGGPNTILAVAMQQSNVSSDTEIRCDGDLVAKNYATNFSNVTMNFQCDDDIIVSKTGNDDATIVITFVPYLTGDYSTSTQYGYNPTANIASTSDVQVYGSISAGEAMIAFLILCSIAISLMVALAQALSNIATKKRFLGYSGGDVEIRDDY